MLPRRQNAIAPSRWLHFHSIPALADRRASRQGQVTSDIACETVDQRGVSLVAFSLPVNSRNVNKVGMRLSLKPYVRPRSTLYVGNFYVCFNPWLVWILPTPGDAEDLSEIPSLLRNPRDSISNIAA